MIGGYLPFTRDLCVSVKYQSAGGKMGGRRSLTSKQVTEIGLIQVTRKGVARNLDEADFRYLLHCLEVRERRPPILLSGPACIFYAIGRYE